MLLRRCSALTLLNYWPMSNFTDVVGGASLSISTSKYSFAYNQLCSSNAAIYFTNGTMNFPTGIYISGDFTLIYWLYVYPFGTTYQSLTYFGFTSNSYIFTGINVNQYLQLMVNGTSLLSVSTVSTYTWYYVAYTVSGTTATIFLNGYANKTATVPIPLNISRTSNFFGGGTVNSILSGIKLYSGAMSAASVYSDFLSSSNNGLNLFQIF